MTNTEKNNIQYLKINNMSCASCVATIESALKQVPRVTTATVNFAERTAEIQGDPSIEDLIHAVAAAGYNAMVVTSFTEDEHEHHTQEKKLLNNTIIAFIVGIPLVISDMFYPIFPLLIEPGGRVTAFIIAIVTLLALIYSGGHIYRGAWQALCSFTANMDTLIALGTGSAWLYSFMVIVFLDKLPHLAQHIYFEAAIVIIAFINLGALLENRARGKTSKAIKRLLDLQVKTARVIRNNEEIDIPIDAVVTGDIIRIRPGEKIPVDGIVTEGESHINEAMVTGESMPVHKTVGDEVIGGTINVDSSLLFEANRVGQDTMLAQIIGMVRTAQNSKPPIGRMVDQIAAYFVPIVILIAASTALIWSTFGPDPKSIFALVTSVTVLIIACPCALGLATPIAIMVGVGKAAEFGALIRNGDALQEASKLSTLILDKTGTITTGHPDVDNIIPVNNWNEERILQYAYSLERQSEHPIAQTIVNYAKAKKIEPIATELFQNLEGFGVRGKVENQWVIMGNEKFMKKNLVDLSLAPSELSQSANTLVYLACDTQLIGIIVVSDQIKPDSKIAIKRLQALGLKLILLTGDNEATAKAVAQQVGIKDVIADVLPHQKLSTILQQQKGNKHIGMVGDGINDAPALAQANVGFAIGTGTDVAIESADIALIRGSLHSVVDAIMVSKATVRNIKQNLFGAFIFNSVGIPIAAGILYPWFHFLLNPMIAGAAMAFSSVTVVSNANRLRFLKTTTNTS